MATRIERNIWSGAPICWMLLTECIYLAFTHEASQPVGFGRTARLFLGRSQLTCASKPSGATARIFEAAIARHVLHLGSSVGVSIARPDSFILCPPPGGISLD